MEWLGQLGPGSSGRRLERRDGRHGRAGPWQADIASSLRYPASATGACTVKPGLGRVPAYNPSATAERGLLAQLMSVQGVIAREIRDVRLAMGAGALRRARPWMVPMPSPALPTLPGRGWPSPATCWGSRSTPGSTRRC
ncbi:MAG: amidase family protein [Burkholderiaceae bacterium]